MTYSLVTLQELVEEKIMPQAIVRQPLTDEELTGWKSIALTELKHLRQAFLEGRYSDKDKWRLTTQLVEYSNTIGYYLHTLTPIWRNAGNAAMIRQLYLELLHLFETHIDQLKRTEPDFALDIPLTHYALPQALELLKSRMAELRRHLEATAVNSTLKDLLLNGLQRFLRKTAITTRSINYLEALMSALLKSASIITSDLERVLYTYDFNLPDFFIYYVNTLQLRLQDTPGLHEQLEVVMLETDRLNVLPQFSKSRLLLHDASLSEQLKGYLNEKSEVIKQLIKLRRIILKDQELAKTATRMKINLSVAQFGLFIRLQMEKGLLPKENVGELFAFFAAHFYTPQTLFISAESLQKKSTDVEYATASKLKGYLIEMINWLNEHFRLSESK